MLTLEQQDTLILSHMWLAKIFAARFYAVRTTDAVTFAELYSAALLGLVEAGRTHDDTLGYKFSSWAGWKIKAELWKERDRRLHEKGFVRQRNDDGTTSRRTSQHITFPSLSPYVTRTAAVQPMFDGDLLVEDMLEKLDIRQAIILRHTFFEGMTPRQIAEEIGLKASRISKDKFLGIRKLRELAA